jgi:hypothetical protein
MTTPQEVLGLSGRGYAELRHDGVLRSSPSDDAYRAQHRTGGRALDLVDAEDVGKLVDLIFCQVLLIMVLEDVHALPRLPRCTTPPP